MTLDLKTVLPYVVVLISIAVIKEKIMWMESYLIKGETK